MEVESMFRQHNAYESRFRDCYDFRFLEVELALALVYD